MITFEPFEVPTWVVYMTAGLILGNVFHLMRGIAYYFYTRNNRKYK